VGFPIKQREIEKLQYLRFWLQGCSRTGRPEYGSL